MSDISSLEPLVTLVPQEFTIRTELVDVTDQAGDEVTFAFGKATASVVSDLFVGRRNAGVLTAAFDIDDDVDLLDLVDSLRDMLAAKASETPLEGIEGLSEAQP